MKKRICVVIMLVALIMVACGKSVDTSAIEENYEEVSMENLFYGVELSTFEPWEREPETIPEGEPATEDVKREVNYIGRNVVDFINNTYHTDWDYIDIDVFIVDVDQYYGGFYCHTDKNMYINKNYIFGNIEDKNLTPAIEAIVVHEMIHAVTDSNRGTPFFYKWYSEDSTLGGYIHEAVTELIKEEYLDYKGIQLKDIYADGMSSGYVHIVYYLRALDAAIPGAVNDILCDNMSELEERVEEKAGNKEAFDRWLFFLDFTQIEYLDSIEGEEDAINPFIMVYAITEFMEGISDENALLSEINTYFDKAFGSYSGEQYCDTIQEAYEIMMSME